MDYAMKLNPSLMKNSSYKNIMVRKPKYLERKILHFVQNLVEILEIICLNHKLRFSSPYVRPWLGVVGQAELPP